MGKAANGSQKADPDSTKAINKALSETLRPVAPGNFVSPAMFFVEWEPIEISWHAAREICHGCQRS